MPVCKLLRVRMRRSEGLTGSPGFTIIANPRHMLSTLLARASGTGLKRPTVPGGDRVSKDEGMPGDANSEWGNPVVESLEHFYAMPVEQVAEKLRTDLCAAQARGLGLRETAAALRCDEFSQLYLEQQRSRPADRIGGMDMAAGHLRAAFIGRELVPVPKGGRPTVYMDGRHLGQDRLPSALSTTRGEIKAALCYAHDLVLEDPFDEEQDLAGLVRQVLEMDPSADAAVLPDPGLFVANVNAIAEIAPLSRSGVVRFSPRGLAMNPKLAGRNASNAWDASREPGAAERELIDRMIRVWLHSGGTIVPVFANDLQEQRFADLLGLLAATLDTAEAGRLRKLGTLALPSADGLDFRSMLEIRHETVFQSFRSRQRAVLAVIGEQDPGDVRARRMFREEMRAAADEVTVKTRRKGFAKSLSTELIGWGVGEIVAMSFDWRAAAAVLAAAATSTLANFLSSSAAQAVADATPSAKRALHHHYATLGEEPR